MTASDRRVGIAAAERIVGLERTTIGRKVRAGAFPPPLYIGLRRSWLESELLAWVAAEGTRPREDRGTAFRHLVPSPAPASTVEPCGLAGESPSRCSNGPSEAP
jgi:predicted DNA-binding transcriptional regulator AlpA